MTDSTTATESPGALPSMRLDGKVALVTGAGRGIGRGTALALAEAGAEVVAWSRTATEIESLAAEIEAAGGKARAQVVDDHAAAWEAIKRIITGMIGDLFTSTSQLFEGNRSWRRTVE